MKKKNSRLVPGVSSANKAAAHAAAVFFAAVMLSGCAGPSTRVLPTRQGGTMQDVPDEIPVVEEVNSFYLQESLQILSESPRPSGSRGEDYAARYIQKLLKDYGYTVNRQRFREKTEHEELFGTNVTAVREAEDPDADILLICTWHDSMPDSPGAGKNASGVSVFLETARILSGLPTDTELRFVSLSAHEKDALGARMYVKGLSRRERERLIGCIILGPGGAVDTEGTVLATQDGKATMLGELVQQAAAEVTGTAWQYVKKAGSENGILASYGIPSVQIGQHYDSFDFGTPLDTVETVDAECLSEIVDTVCQAVSGIMSLDTPSMRAKAHFENNWNEFTYAQEPEERIPFGTSPESLQASLGVPGQLAVVNRDAKNRPIEKYQFTMNWFRMAELFKTSYYFTDEQLDLVSLTPEKAGVTAEEVQKQLCALYGEPSGKNQGPYGTDAVWLDVKNGTQIELIHGKEGFEIELSSYIPEVQMIARFDRQGNRLDEGEALTSDEEALKKLCYTVLSPQSEPSPSAELVFTSDGKGADVISVEKRAASADERVEKEHDGEKKGESSDIWEVHIDPADFLPSNGEPADRTWTLKKLVRTYGQLLSEADPELYTNGYEALLQKIRDRDAQNPDTQNPDTQNPDIQNQDTQNPDAQNQDAEPESNILNGLPDLPEFADAFAMYVLAELPSGGAGSYQECVHYFDQFEELNTYRSTVRTALGLQTEE